jgi:[acyl-carrier-protein] S-malonyltransferase
MQAAVPQGHGSMFAILGGSDELILQLCKEASQRSQELVSPANYNAPGQTVIAGTTYALQSALELSKTHEGFKGLKLIPLSVSAPFHCALMKPAREKMQELFEAYSQTHPIAPLQVPYYPNRTAMLSQDSSQILKLLEEQVDHPVLWKQSMTALLSERPQVVIEAGPGKVLTGLMKRITKEMKLDTELKLFNLTSLDDFRALENHFKGA